MNWTRASGISSCVMQTVCVHHPPGSQALSYHQRRFIAVHDTGRQFMGFSFLELERRLSVDGTYSAKIEHIDTFGAGLTLASRSRIPAEFQRPAHGFAIGAWHVEGLRTFLLERLRMCAITKPLRMSGSDRYHSWRNRSNASDDRRLHDILLSALSFYMKAHRDVSFSDVNQAAVTNLKITPGVLAGGIRPGIKQSRNEPTHIRILR